MATPERNIKTKRDGATITLSMARPQVLNAITTDMLKEMLEALSRVSNNDGIRVVVLTGEGRAFSAGLDLREIAADELDRGSVGAALENLGSDVTKLISSMPKIVIARVNGACFAGALELALACDLVVASYGALFGDTHARWGFQPSWGMSQRLARAVGIQRARELSYTGRTFSGSQAAEWGLAVRACPDAELDSVVGELAQSVIANSPGVVHAYKDLYEQSLEVGLSAGLDYESTARYEITDTRQRLSTFNDS